MLGSHKKRTNPYPGKNAEGKVVDTDEDDYNSVDYAKAEKNFKAMSILQYRIIPDEYSRISACTKAKGDIGHS